MRPLVGVPIYQRVAFPKLWTAIRDRYLQRKKTAALERRNLLRQSVREIVADLSSRGIHPKVSLVQSVLRDRSNDSFRSLDVICEAIREALAVLST
jgi:predicted transcriptional regulator